MPWSSLQAPGPGSGSDASPRLPVLFVYSDEQWEALSSALRLEILLFLRSRGPCSPTELGHMLDVSPDGLYHHLDLLTRCGLSRQVGTRRAPRGRTEKLYDAASQRVKLDADPATGRNSARLERLLEVVSTRAMKHTASALAARRARLDEPAPDLVIHADAAWLDDEDLARLNEHMESIRRLFEAGRSRRRGKLCSLMLALSPVVRQRGAHTRPTRRLKDLDEGHARAAPPIKAQRKRSLPRG